MIKLSLVEKQKFVDSYIANEIDLQLINTKENTAYKKVILDEFDDLLELSNEKNLVSWHKHIKHHQIEISDLKERLISTKSGQAVIGIRFLGMDEKKPFVSIWTNFPIEKELENILAITKQEFKIFKPLYLRFWVKPNSLLAKKYAEHNEQNYFANTIEAICKLEKPINYDQIVIKKTNSLDFIEWYTHLFEAFHKEQPELKYLVPANTEEDFQESIACGLLYLIFYKNTQIGVLSAVKDTFIGEDSLYITEIVIEKEYKGKKLASAIQRKLIEENKNDYKYIWGKISNKNIPSTKNALRVGRKKISSEILLAFYLFGIIFE